MKQEEKNIEKHITRYMEQIEIPDQLNQCVQQSIEQGKLHRERINIMRKRIKGLTVSAAAVGIAFVGTANLSPTFAKTMSEIPVLKSLINVVTWRQFDYEEENYEVHIDTPVVEGLEDKMLQAQLNEKYLEENKELFEQFKEEVKQIEELGGKGHLGTDVGYEIKTDNEDILSIGRYIAHTAGSASTTIQYDTIDKKNEILITLPSLFKDDTYVSIISENIKLQMKEQMAEDENKIYWLEGEEELIEGFKRIDSNQNFYINNEGKLVIAFGEYEVAPGYMGIVEFEIPTSILKTILVSGAYIK